MGGAKRCRCSEAMAKGAAPWSVYLTAATRAHQHLGSNAVCVLPEISCQRSGKVSIKYPKQ